MVLKEEKNAVLGSKCTGIFWTVYGLPCSHIILEKKLCKETLQVKDFISQWRLVQPNITEIKNNDLEFQLDRIKNLVKGETKNEERHVISQLEKISNHSNVLNPKDVKTKGRPTTQISNTTKRELSKFEHVESSFSFKEKKKEFFEIGTTITWWKEHLLLEETDKELILRKGWLNDKIMSAAFLIMFNTMADKNKFELFSLKIDDFKIPNCKRVLQYTNVNGNHWILVDIQHDKKNLDVYCSLRQKYNNYLSNFSNFKNYSIVIRTA
jgi:hypothetical protein